MILCGRFRQIVPMLIFEMITTVPMSFSSCIGKPLYRLNIHIIFKLIYFDEVLDVLANMASLACCKIFFVTDLLISQIASTEPNKSNFLFCQTVLQVTTFKGYFDFRRIEFSVAKTIYSFF